MKKGYIAVIIAMIAWGVSFINSKIVLASLQPMTLCFIRFSIALVILTGVKVSLKRSLKIKREDFKYFIIAGGIGITVYFYFENTGVKYISPSSASLILASLPIFTVLAESFFDEVTLKLRMILGGILSLIGVGIIISKDMNFNELTFSSIKGYLMMFGAILTWVMYSLTTKKLFGKYDQFTIVYYQFLFGVVFASPFIFIENNHWALVDQTIVLNVLILGIFASTMGFFLYNYSMRVLGVSKSSLFINFIPVVTVIASFFYYGELISWHQLVGGAIIIISVLINHDKDEIEVNEHKSVV